MKSKKNKILILIVVIIFIGFGGYFFQKINNYKNIVEEQKGELKNYEDSYSKIYHKLTSFNKYDFEKRIESGDDVYLYIGYAGCKDCDKFEDDFLVLIDKYKLEEKLNYFNLSSLSSEELSPFSKKHNIEHVPTLAKYKNGKVENKIEWTEEKDFPVEMVEKWIVDNDLE